MAKLQSKHKKGLIVARRLGSRFPSARNARFATEKLTAMPDMDWGGYLLSVALASSMIRRHK